MSASGASAKALLKNAWRVTKQVALQKSRTELCAIESTGDAPWGPTGAQMTEISEACFDAEKFKQAWAVILKRFESEPAQWRRVYKALLLTEHLLKNSSQHVVQTILDAAPILEGLKQFKYLDEKNKDHGINVSNRAKELVLLLEDPDRIRAERQKAKSLKEKFKGASREQMAEAAGGSGPAPGWGSTGGSHAYASAGGLERHSAASFGSSAGGFERRTAGGPAHARGADDEGHLGEEGPVLSGEARPKGYGVVPSHTSDPVAATAQRISSMRQAGLLRDEEGPSAALPRPSSESSLGGLGTGAAGAGMHSSASHDDLSVAHSSSSQPAKPSLHELAARRAGPKKLQEVRVNPAIASSLAALSGKPAAAPAVASKPAVVAPPPPLAAKPEPVATLANLLAPPAEPHSAQRTASGVSSGAASPARAATSPQHGAACQAGRDAFEGAGSGHSTGPASPTAAAVPVFDAFAAHKPAASPGAISLTATAGAAPAGSPPALPAYLFAEPTPPGYTAASSWGSHVSGAGAAAPPTASPTALKGATLAKAPSHPEDALFADFSPFK